MRMYDPAVMGGTQGDVCGGPWWCASPGRCGWRSGGYAGGRLVVRITRLLSPY